MAPADFPEPIVWGMIQSALMNPLGQTHQQAVDMMAWYEGDIPTEWTSLQDYTDFAIVIYNAYTEAHPPE